MARTLSPPPVVNTESQFLTKTIIRKDATQTISSNDTVLVSDSHLKFTAAANTTWIVDYWLSFTITGSGSSNLIMAIDAPAGSRVTFFATRADTSATSTYADTEGLVVEGSGTPVTIFLPQSNDDRNALLFHAVVTTSTLGGVVSLQYAKAAAGGRSVAIDIGSMLRAVKSGTAQKHLTVVKLTDEIVVNSTTVQDDNEFQFAIAANEVWAVDMWLYVPSSSATPNIKIALAGSATTTIMWWLAFAGSASDALLSQHTYDITDTVIHSIGAAAPGQMCKLRALVTVGATAGTFSLQWAQGTLSTTINTIVKAGSSLEAVRTG